MSQPSRGPADRDPDPPTSLVQRAASQLPRVLPLALVPLATALFRARDLLATGRTAGVSLRASFPVYRYDLWSFVDAPRGGGVTVSLPFDAVDPLPFLVPLIGVYVVASGALSAGYFGASRTRSRRGATTSPRPSAGSAFG